MEHKFFQEVQQMALSLPGMVEGISYGTPAFKLKGKMIARFHQDGVSLVLKMDFDTRDFLMQVNPEVYYITDHYKNYPYVLIRLIHVDLDDLKGHILRVWKENAPKKLLKELNMNNETN